MKAEGVSASYVFSTLCIPLQHCLLSNSSSLVCRFIMHLFLPLFEFNSRNVAQDCEFHGVVKNLKDKYLNISIF